MKLWFSSVCSVLVVILGANVLRAQSGRWEQLNGQAGGYSLSIAAAADSSVYLVTRSELFQYVPHARAWVRRGILPSPIVPNYASRIPPLAYGNKLFLADEQDGISVSSDGGMNWTKSSRSCEGIAPSGRSLYAIGWDFDSREYAIFRSVDTGSLWKVVFEDSSIQFNCITQGLRGKLYVSSNAGIYSNSSGDTVWSRVDNVANVREWAQIFEVDSAICLASPYSGNTTLYRTSNAGRSWDGVADFGTIGPITQDSDGALWVATQTQGIRMSSDRGKSWVDGHFKDPVDAIATSFCVTPSNAILMKTLQHIYQYSRSTGEWSLWEDSLRIASVYAILPMGDDSMLILCSDGYYRTYDGGQRWTKDSVMENSVTVTDNLSVPSPGKKILRDKDGNLFSMQLRYDPSAHKWTRLIDTEHTVENNPLVVAIDSSGYLFSASGSGYGNGIIRSSDHGITWIALPESHDLWNDLVVDTKGRLFASTQGGITRSEDHGTTWKTIFNQWSELWLGVLCVTQNGNIFAACAGSDSMSNSFSMIESSDDGASWQIASRAIYPTSFALDGDSTVFLSCTFSDVNGSGILKSTDAGGTWNMVSSSLDTDLVFVTVTPNHQLFAGSRDDGLFRYAKSSASVDVAVTNSNNEFTGYLHLGNPRFVECTLPDLRSSGTVDIYDILGRLIIRQEVSPDHQDVRIPLPLSASGLSEGCFLVVCENGQTIRTRITTVRE